MSAFAKLAGLVMALACLPGVHAATRVDDAALSDQKQGANWLSYGRNYSEQRYSPLDQVNAESVSRLGLAWSMDLPEDRTLLSTPLVIDGVMYFTGSYSVARAVDAKTGKLIWQYDPKVIEHAGDRLRVMMDSSRGLAYWKGTVIIATVDGRLVALDAKNGKPRWSTQTTDVTKPVYITGHPTAFRGLVIVGNGGTEHGASRGYVSAYHVTSGKLAWRFFVVPGNPADGFEDAAQAMAAKTWTGEWWKHGGGGNTWNGFTYDPEFDQILIGTGNGSPWNQKVRSPGGGDNLFLCSIVALDARTGRYKWHYQTAPGETWDYNSSMDIVLADLKLEGGPVKALLHAPKNGFFYVIDRKDGKLLSTGQFAKVTWASGIDMKTGRPIETPNARYQNGEEVVWPGPNGAHSWHAMSFSPKTGLVYIPKMEQPIDFNDKAIAFKDWKRAPDYKIDLAVDPGLGNDIPAGVSTSSLVAWDPIRQIKVWEQPEPEYWNPGTMATAGNLVFQGRVDGEFAAYKADTGDKVWSVNVGLGISAPPVTYAVDGKQYVSLLVGWGGNGVAVAGGTALAQFGWGYRAQTRRLLTFALDGKLPMPPSQPKVFAQPIVSTDFNVDDTLASRGEGIYMQSNCVMCHSAGAVSGGAAPDLRASPIVLQLAAFRDVVVAGSRLPRGMPRFKELGDDDLTALQHYIRRQAIVTTRAAADRKRDGG